MAWLIAPIKATFMFFCKLRFQYQLFNKKRTKRNADLFPIHGKLEISLTAFSINFEENSIKQTYKF